MKKGDMPLQVEGNLPAELDSIKSRQMAKIKKSKEELEALNGIGARTVEILRQNGIQTIETLASTSAENLKGIQGIGQKSAEKYIKVAKNHMGQSVLTHYLNSPTSLKEGDESFHDEEDDYLREIGGELVDLTQEESSGEKLLEPPLLNNLKKEDHSQNDGEAKITIESCLQEEVPFPLHDEFREKKEEMIIIEDDVPKKNESRENETFQAVSNAEKANISKKKENVLPSKRPLTSLEAEKLTPSRLKNIISDVEDQLKSLDYWILKGDKKRYESLLKLIDLMAIRSFEVSDLLELIILIPIKISQGMGKHRVYEEEIKYTPANRKKTLNAAEKRLLIDSNIASLRIMREEIFDNITNEGVLFHYLAKYVNKDIFIERTLTGKELFLTSGHKCHEIITCPVLVTDGSVEFLENRMAPFAWQRNANIHFINKMNLKDLVHYLEKKHVLIETHAIKKNLIDDYLEIQDRLYSKLRYFSLPFMVYAGLLLFIAFFNSQALPTFIWIGIGLSLLFGVITGLFFLSLLNAQHTLHDYYNTPYHQRPLEIDEAGIILINEELPREWMHQFIYEADMNTKQLETTRSIETEGLRTVLDEYSSFSPPEIEDDEDEDITLNKENSGEDRFRSRPSMIQKYQKFMED